MSSDSRLSARSSTQLRRSGGANFNRSTRNMQARNIIAGRVGAGGTATRRQLREAIANQGSRRGRRFRTL